VVYLPSKLSALECLRGGFTTAVDAGTRSAGHVGRLANAARETGLRIVIARICNDLGGSAEIADRHMILRTAEAHLAQYDSDPPQLLQRFGKRIPIFCWISTTVIGWSISSRKAMTW
jgi:5-methylthioadenosine/S-adenosylhomocysteine deaminase